MKALKLVGVVLLVFVMSGFVFGWIEIRRGFSARAEPFAVEALMATMARKLALPLTYRQLRNPFAASPENIQAGTEHFADHCATCHANDGSGDTLFGKGLYPKPPDMRKAATQRKSDGELYYIIENGVRLSGMPAFGEHAGTDDAETWRLVIFIRHLPQITTEELQAMNKLNPKTEADRAEEQQEEKFLNGSEVPGTSVEAEHHH
jgi:mono/diheme cytochrome c family protein